MKFKRVMSIILVLCLILEILPSVAVAAETKGKDKGTINNMQAVQPEASQYSSFGALSSGSSRDV